MPLRATAGIPGPGCDTSAKLSAKHIATISSAGLRWIARYVPLPGNGPGEDIDAGEAESICAMGLQLLLVQHVRYPGWDPARCSGEEDGRFAAQHAAASRYPSGCHMFVDLEGLAPGASPADTKIYAESWARSVGAGGYRAGVYVGYGVPVSSMELWLLRGVNSYWSDPGPRSVSVRGFAILQGPSMLGGLVDRDTMTRDCLGDVPIMASIV